MYIITNNIRNHLKVYKLSILSAEMLDCFTRKFSFTYQNSQVAKHFCVSATVSPPTCAIALYSFKHNANKFIHLIVKGKEEGVILPFVSFCISDDLSNIPVEALGRVSSEHSCCSLFHAGKH